MVRSCLIAGLISAGVLSAPTIHAGACPRIASSTKFFTRPPDPDAVQSLARWVDDSTYLVIRADLSACDPSTLLADAADTLRAGPGKGDQADKAAKQLTEVAAYIKLWREQFIAAGGGELWIIGSLPELTDAIQKGQAPIVIVVPIPMGSRVEELRNALARIRPAGFDVASIDGYLVAGNSSRVRAVRPDDAPGLATLPLSKPVRGDELRAALAAGPQAPLHLLFMPPKFVRRAFLELAPTLPAALDAEPMTTITQGLTAASASVWCSPNARLNIATTAQDAEAAARLSDYLCKQAAKFKEPAVAGSDLVPRGLSTLVSSYPPRVEQDRLIWNLDQAALRELVAQVAAVFTSAQEQAGSLRVATDIRGVVQGCWVYASQNKDQWPDDLNMLVTGGMISADMLRGPGEGRPMLIYRKPSPESFRNHPAETPVVYPQPDPWPAGGLWVGFVDGHVEKVTDRERFNTLLQAAGTPAKP